MARAKNVIDLNIGDILIYVELSLKKRGDLRQHLIDGDGWHAFQLVAPHLPRFHPIALRVLLR
jgi:hypothetical protein